MREQWRSRSRAVCISFVKMAQQALRRIARPVTAGRTLGPPAIRMASVIRQVGLGAQLVKMTLETRAVVLRVRRRPALLQPLVPSIHSLERRRMLMVFSSRTARYGLGKPRRIQSAPPAQRQAIHVGKSAAMQRRVHILVHVVRPTRIAVAWRAVASA